MSYTHKNVPCKPEKQCRLQVSSELRCRRKASEFAEVRCQPQICRYYVRNSLNGIRGDIGEYSRGYMKGDTRSSDYSSRRYLGLRLQSFDGVLCGLDSLGYLEQNRKPVSMFREFSNQ